MRRGIWIVSLCLLGLRMYGQPQQALQQLLETEGLKSATVGIAVSRVKGGENIVSHFPDMALTPASVMKLFPTCLALQEKGENYRYKTPVYYTGRLEDGVLFGNIVIKAGGDPTLNSRYFSKHLLVEPLVNVLRELGIHRIEGNIKVKGTCKGSDIPGSWLWEDVSNYYAALYLPFNYRDNTFVIHFKSGNPGSVAKLIAIKPTLPGVSINCEVKASAVNKDDAWIYGGPYSSVLCVKGTIPPNRSDFQVKGAMHDPAAFFVWELEEELRCKEIEVKGRELPDTAEKICTTFVSPALRDIVYTTNKVSMNLFAEALGALVAEDNWPERAKALLAQAGIDVSGVILKDACGLSPMDAVPAKVFTDLLVYIGCRENDAFMRSLPIGGVDGGLAGYCVSNPLLKNNLKAKTGSMSGVRCLAGYLTRKNGEQLAFTILINHYTCTTSQLQAAVGAFLQSLL